MSKSNIYKLQQELNKATRFTAEQIESIINKLVPLIAAPEDHEFFRGILTIKAENSTSGQFALFVNEALRMLEKKETAPAA